MVDKKKIRLNPSIKICLGFMLLILLGSLLLSLPIANRNGEWLGFVDAFFTSTSAVCVTGLVVVDTATQFTLFGQFVILFLIQIGGLGIVAITSLVFLILRKKITLSSRMALQESFNRENLQGVVKFIRRVIILTLAIEGVGALCLLYSTITYFGSFWKGLFAAIFTSISTFCNAGFDIFGNELNQFMSLMPFASNILMLLPIMLLIVLGGIGFVVMIDGFKTWRSSHHARIVIYVTLILILGGAILYMIAEWNNPLTIGNMPWWDKIFNCLFQSVATRTAGCASIDQGGLTPFGTLITILLMFIGGSPTSTAGGIKTTTFFIIVLMLFKFPNSQGSIVYKGRKISANIINKAFKIVMYTLTTVMVAILLITLIEGDLDLMSIIFECVSAISTVGFSMGITPMLSGASKIIIALLMFVGRVGMTTIVLGLSTRSQVDNQVEYINTDIIVG